MSASGRSDKQSATPESTKKQVTVKVSDNNIKNTGKKKPRSAHPDVVRTFLAQYIKEASSSVCDRKFRAQNITFDPCTRCILTMYGCMIVLCLGKYLPV